MTRKLDNKAGLTLVEIVMALGIFAFIFVALMGSVAVSFGNVTASRDRVQAVKEAQSILNEIRALEDASPAEIQELFPAGEVDPPRENLPAEVITAEYIEEGSALHITIVVQWRDQTGRTVSERLTTVLTGN